MIRCQPGSPALIALGCEVFDFNGNDTVDLRDLAAYQRAFMTP